MKSETWERIESLYHAALERAPEERTGFLDDACAGDEELRREVAALLAYDDVDSGFIEAPALEVAARALAAQSPDEVPPDPSDEANYAEATGSEGLPTDSLRGGEMVNSFRILSKIGQGGMGEVYLAEDTRLGRKVALKLIAPDLVANSQARARFVREARLASTLDHPNICTIHEVGESSGRSFIAMQYVAGRTLKQVINDRPLSLDSLLSIGVQMADALALAHAQGIIHRDIKSNNIVITERGQVKILDFGLAKPLEMEARGADTDLTQSGVALGTPGYMSPEQARGERSDHRSDIFSFGVVLYEMATGRTPFKGRSQAETMNAVINHPHRPVLELNSVVPMELSRIVDRVLPKEPGDRYQSIEDVASDLRRVMQSIGAPTPASALEQVVTSRRRPLIRRVLGWTEKDSAIRWTLTFASIVVVAAVVVWFYWRNANLKWARASVARIEELSREDKYVEAYVLALEARKYLANDPALERLMPIISDDLSVVSEPPGARVYLKHFARGERDQLPARELIGTTPINNLQIARDHYIIEIERDGYAPFQRSVSSTLDRVQRAILGPPELRREVKMIETRSGELAILFDSYAPIRIVAKLIPSFEAPDRSVYVPGGEYSLVSYGKPTDSAVPLGDYFIDRFEVTNREYKEFINAGGYVKRQFWRYPFRKDGEELSWEEALQHFKDRTGLEGPRRWSSQNFPEGKQDHPVTDITWYEAAAYAEFRGKQLPTIFQWEKAARDGAFTHTHWFIMPWGLSGTNERIEQRANFLGSGTVPAESLEFGMSPYGCYQMAGNVAEWCLNPSLDGFATAGGSWKDPHYLFASVGSYPGFYSADTLGFRCVLKSSQATGDQGAFPLNSSEEIPTYKPTSEARFQELLRHYQYDRTPLDSQIEEVKETEVWRREKITYAGAGGQRAFAYLYLPRNTLKPLQAIHYVPTDGTYYAMTVPDEVEAHAAPYIKAGRAVFAVVLKGYKERPQPADFISPELDSVRYREQVVNWATDLRRGMDYLTTRAEIDPGKIACYGVSVNPRKLTLIAVETRYRSVILMGGGLIRSWASMIPEANGANFASHIRAPKLMIHGRYDEAIPYKTEAEPLYRLLREPKELVLIDYGHVPPLDVSVRIINTWLDKTLGPVKRE